MKGGIEMDGQMKRELMEKIDHYVSVKQMVNSEAKIAEVMKPEIERLSNEYHVDMVDLFVAYMDHVAIKSKKMANEKEKMLENLDSPEMKLY